MRALMPVAGCAGLILGLVLVAAVPGGATVRLREQAKELGYPADDCSYCHTFSHDHMAKHAREAGLATTNCIYCHGDQLPLDGVELYNERGKYLLAQKKAHKAKRTDVQWLEGYVEQEPEGGEEKPATSPQLPPATP